MFVCFSPQTHKVLGPSHTQQGIITLSAKTLIQGGEQADTLFLA